MAFSKQTWTLTKKTMVVVFVRHWFFTTIRAFLAPIIFMFFITYAQNLFVPPSEFGIGSPRPIRSFPNALAAAQGNRNTVVFVNNGNTGGDIGNVINSLADTVRQAGKTAQIVEQEVDLLTLCPSSLRGASTCYGAASFYSSPENGGSWNYTIMSDGVLGSRIYADSADNDIQIYVLPFQRAIDSAIASSGGNAALPTTQEYPFTDETQKERDEDIRTRYMGALINIIAVALYIGVCGVTYQLTGQMASEREGGLSQLIEAMAPAKKPWHTQASRLLSNHLAFDIIYLPGWIIMAAIVQVQAFPGTNVGILIVYHILAGFALSSFSIFGASFFRKAQLSGITMTILTIVLAIIAQVAGPFNTAAIAVLSLIFPSMNYVFFIIYVARFERVLRPTNLGHGAPDYNGHKSTLPGIVFWIFLIIQIFVYPVLGAFVERWLYGTISKERKTSTSSPDHSIILSNFSKHWSPTWLKAKVAPKLGVKAPETVVAVNDLSIKARRGQIMVLLGANGSGKSTTLDAIAGLNIINNGSIEIDGTGGLGLCPQKNVMWDELTVFEHVRLFNSLKSTGKGDSKDSIRDLIRACDLGHKMSAKSNTLSGGQKRKLQLAMMFTGGSRVCCVDEVTSGLDPLSRRKIWDILLAERGDRTFLFTTHFLDEADVLADYIAVLSRGSLKAKGTSVQLKHEYGSGYRVTVPRNIPVGNGLQVEKAWKTTDDKAVYLYPTAAGATTFIAELRRNGIKDYDLMGPTLEDVFLNLAEEIRGNNLHDVQEVEHSPEDDDNSGENGDPITEENKRLEMSKGRGTSMPKQTWILARKRFTILRRNVLPYACALLLPIIAAGLVTLFLHGYERVGCQPGAYANIPDVFSLSTLGDNQLIPVGPPSSINVDLLARASGLNSSSFVSVNTLDEFNNFIDNNFHNVTPGGFFLPSNGDAVMAYIGNDGVIAGLITLNALDSVLLTERISAQWSSFQVPFAPGTGDTLQLILYFGLAMSVYPAFFALYPTVERLRKVRALHYSNGIRAAPLWVAYLAFDFFFVLVISAIVVAIFTGVSSAFYAPGYLFVIFFLYGLASALLCYLVSIFATSQLAAFAFAAGGQASFFLLYFIGFMCILTFVPAYAIDDSLKTFHFAFAIISPSANILQTMFISLNVFSQLCDGQEVASYPGSINVYGGPILYLIIQSAVFLIVLVWWDSGYKPALLSRNASKSRHAEELLDGIDPAVLAEVERTEQSSDSLRVLHLHKTFGSNHAVNDITFGIPQAQVFALLGPNGAGKSSTISLIRGDIHPSHRGGDVEIEGISVVAKRALARGHLGVCPQFDAMDSMTVREHLLFYARARGVPDIRQNVTAVMTATGLTHYQNRLAHKLSGGNKRKLSLGIALMGNPSVLLLDEPSSGMDAAAKRVMWRTLLGVAAPGRALLITTHSMEEADKLATCVGIMKRRMLALGSVDELGDKYGDAWVVQLVLRSAPHTSEEEMGVVRSWVRSNIRGAELDKWGAKGSNASHGMLRFKVLKNHSSSAIDGTPSTSQTEESQSLSEGDTTREKKGLAEETSEVTAVDGIPGLIQLLEANREHLGLEYYSVSPTTLDEVFLRVVGEEEEEEVKPKQKLRPILGKWACI